MSFHREIWRARLCRFVGRDDGVAAIEFAIILPVLITMYFGVFELTRAIDNSRKVSAFARTVADLTGQLPAQTAGKAAAVSPADMTAIFDSAKVILLPFDANAVKIVVSTVGVEKIKGKRQGRVCSSFAKNATVRPELQAAGTDGLADIPASFDVDGARYLVAEVSMPYYPVIGTNLYKLIFGDQGLSFSRQIPWAERNGEVVLPPNTNLCPTS